MTGLVDDQVSDLVARVASHGLWRLRRRRALDAHRSVTVVLLYLRHNLSQPVLAELFGCSQPTISRLITQLLPLLTEVLTPIAQATAEHELRSTVRVDGFLVPIGDRRKDTYTSGMYSGKGHRCGFNVQVVASWHGRLVMTGKPQPGACTTPAPGKNLSGHVSESRRRPQVGCYRGAASRWHPRSCPIPSPLSRPSVWLVAPENGL